MMKLLKFKLDKYFIFLYNTKLNNNCLVINSKENFNFNFFYFNKFLIKYIYKSFDTSLKKNIFSEIKNLIKIIKIVRSLENINNILDQIIIILINNILFIKEILNEKDIEFIYENLKPINNYKLKFIYILLFHVNKITYFFISKENKNLFKINENYENELLWKYDNL